MENLNIRRGTAGTLTLTTSGLCPTPACIMPAQASRDSLTFKGEGLAGEPGAGMRRTGNVEQPSCLSGKL